ncbi:MAG TPA: hypothetical protein VKZ63_11475 [Kofleriaceae bacterium]|nr:hypothetical protein [Kofleriaceae bacterium]
MTHLTTLSRILLGLGFTAFALNYFVPFLPPPAEPPPPAALEFLGAFASSGFLTLVKAIELVAGLLLLAGLFVPLALTLLAPILVGIVAYHLLLAPDGLGLVVLLLALEIGLAWAYRASFAPMLKARASRTAAPAPAPAGPARIRAA